MLNYNFKDSSDLPFDEDGVSEIISHEHSYLLQHRDNRTGVSYAGWWGLFGGGREGLEDADEALKRELLEEICLSVSDFCYLGTVLYENPTNRSTSRKVFFGLDIDISSISSLNLREGQEMKWYSFQEIFAMASRINPFDLTFLAFYDSLKR